MNSTTNTINATDTVKNWRTELGIPQFQSESQSLTEPLPAGTNCYGQPLPDTAISPLKILCNRARICPPGGRCPTLPDAINYVENILQQHRKHRSGQMNPWTGDYCEWKSRLDELEETLRLFRELQNIIAPKKVSHLEQKNIIESNRYKISQHAPNKQDPTDSAGGTKVGQSGTPAQTTGTKLGQPGTNAGQCGTQPGHPTESIKSKPSMQSIPEPESETNDAIEDDETPNEVEDAEDDTEEEYEPTEEEKEQDEIDTESLFDDFPDDESRIAAASEEFHQQVAGRSKFDQLSYEQQRAIIEIRKTVSVRATVKLLALPPPVGLNFKTDKSSLQRFTASWPERENRRRFQEAKIAADAVLNSKSPHPAFQDATEKLIKTRLLITASDPKANLQEVSALVLNITRLRRQALAEQKQNEADDEI